MGRSDSRLQPHSGLCIPLARFHRPRASGVVLSHFRFRSFRRTRLFGAIAHRLMPSRQTDSPHRVSQVSARSVSTRPPQPPRVAQWVFALISTPLVSDFTSLCRLVATGWCNEAESGSLALGSHLRRPGRLSPFRPSAPWHKDRIALPARLPSRRDPQLRVK